MLTTAYLFWVPLSIASHHQNISSSVALSYTFYSELLNAQEFTTTAILSATTSLVLPTYFCRQAAINQKKNSMSINW